MNNQFTRVHDGKVVPDDYCEACGKRVANHETEAGLLCDPCFSAIYGPEPESQSSKHCDAGYMNDVRFGDGGE